MKLGKFLNQIILLISVLIYSSVLISPSYIWFTGFVSLFIPAVLLFNFFLLVYLVAKNKRLLLYPLASLIIGFPFLKASLAVHPDKNSSKDNLSVLSYNVRFFKQLGAENYGNFSDTTMNFAINDDSGIKCFQEFYSHPEWQKLNMLQLISQKNYQYHYENFTPSLNAVHGLAIFTKYPIINKGNISFSDSTLNGAIFADLLIHNDTIRVYNIHLKSMGIEPEQIISEEIEENYKNIAHRLKRGFTARANQVKKVIDHMNTTSHPVILCGDLNDLPYSYTYSKLNRRLNNAFESAGNGFGFTFNGKLPFLRIDNQFADDSFIVTDFKTLDSVKTSDHFPIKGFYRLENEE